MALGTPIQCKNCGARLPGREPPPLACEYCHARLPVATDAPVVAAPRKPGVGVVVLVGVAVVAAGGYLFTRSAPAPVAPINRPPPPEAPRPPALAPPPPARPALAELVLELGELGSDATRLADPRALAVAGDGSIFVAEHASGRVHRFAADGEHRGQITLPKSKLTHSLSVFGLAADAARLYVVRDGDVLVYAHATGELERTLRGSYPETWYHGDVAVDSAGRVHALTDRTGRLDLVISAPDGKLVERRKNVGARHLAVDGLGTVFLARADTVDVVDARGELEVRFAVARPGPLAVDGRGHVFVAGGGQVTVYDRRGTSLGELETGALRDLAVDAAGALYTLGGAGDKQVKKYRLDLPE